MEDRKLEAIENENMETEACPSYFGSAQDLVDRYTHCALCGSHLHFTHLTDFSRNLTQESAKCPECGFKARRVIHRLQ